MRTIRVMRMTGGAVVLSLLSICSGCVRVRLPAARLVPGGVPQTLSWRRAVELAVAHHPDVLEARAKVESAAHNRNQAFGGYLPSVDASASRSRVRTTNTQPTHNALSWDLDATQPLFTGFSTTAEFLHAKREWEAAKWAYQQTSADVRLRLRSSYAKLLRLKELLEVNRRIAARRQENAEMIQLRYEAGREHRGSLLRAQAIAASAAFEMRQTERRLESQRLDFGRELGGQLWLTAALDDQLEALVPSQPDPPADYAVLAEQTPAVQQQVKTAEAVKAQLLSAQSVLWPTVEASANYGYAGSRVSNLRDEGSVGVTVSLPLFAGGQHIEGILEANADYRAAVEAARSARDARIAALSSAWSAFRDAWEFVDVRRKFIEASRERAEIVRSQYTSGLADFQEFDIAEQELADSEKAYVDSLTESVTQEATWEATKGSTLEDVLSSR